MGAYILAPVAQMNTALLTTPVHPSFYPYPLLATLHCTRVAFVHRSITTRVQASLKPAEQGKITWAYDIFGYLVMCWGGALITSFMMGQIPPQLLSIHPFLNSVSVLLLVTFLLQYIPLPAAKTVDTILILLDGSLRVHGVLFGMGLAMTSSNPVFRGSLLLQVILGTIGATGGGQTAVMLGLHSPTGWSLHTPPVLAATTVAENIDVIMGAICSLVYGLTTLSHPSYSPFLAAFYQSSGKPLFTAVGARAACSILFATGFAYRALVLHWLPATTAVQGAKAKARPSAAATKANGSKR